MLRCLSSTDDASDFFAGLRTRLRLSVDDEQDYVAHHTGRLPSRLVRIRISTRHGVRIVEHEPCRLESETMNSLVLAVFPRVPRPAQCSALV